MFDKKLLSKGKLYLTFSLLYSFLNDSLNNCRSKIVELFIIFSHFEIKANLSSLTFKFSFDFILALSNSSHSKECSHIKKYPDLTFCPGSIYSIVA